MKVLTGTPGTGKTSVAEKLSERGYRVANLNEILEEQGIGEPGKEREVDVEEMRRELEFEAEVLEGHLAHFLPAEVCVVLRCRPDKLRDRLAGRGYSDEKIRENLRAEALDTVLQQAVKEQETVVEIDTTELSVEGVVEKTEPALDSSDSDYGAVDFSDFLGRV